MEVLAVSLLVLTVIALCIAVYIVPKGRQIEDIPVYKEQLGKLTDDYLHDNGYWPGQSPRRTSHAKELAEWQTEFDSLVVLNEPKIIGANSSYEAHILELINAMTNRYGFEHPKTQKLVTAHQKFIARWKAEDFLWDDLMRKYEN